MIEKGIGTLTIEKRFIKAIKKFYKDEQFDLVLYSTPPITFERVIKFIKKRDDARSYLLLKDIFPQNAVDLGMFSKKKVYFISFSEVKKNVYIKYQII